MLTGPGQGRAVVVAIHGRGGVGKSTLAVRAARQAAAGYPDGQLYIDLHGATPGVRPRTAQARMAQVIPPFCDLALTRFFVRNCARDRVAERRTQPLR